MNIRNSKDYLLRPLRFFLPMNASSSFILFLDGLFDLERRKTNPGRVNSHLRWRQGRVRRPAATHRRELAAARVDVVTGRDCWSRRRSRHSEVKLRRRGDVRLIVARRRLKREPVPIKRVELEDGMRSRQVLRHWRRANVEQKAVWQIVNCLSGRKFAVVSPQLSSEWNFAHLLLQLMLTIIWRRAGLLFSFGFGQTRPDWSVFWFCAKILVLFGPAEHWAIVAIIT